MVGIAGRNEQGMGLDETDGDDGLARSRLGGNEACAHRPGPLPVFSLSPVRFWTRLRGEKKKHTSGANPFSMRPFPK